MAAPTTTISAVQRLLVDAALPNRELLTTQQYEDSISRAVAEFSRDRPRVLVHDVFGNGTGMYNLAAVLEDWEDDWSTVSSVDTIEGSALDSDFTVLPVDPERWEVYRAPDGIWLRFLNNAYATTDTIRITYNARHLHEDSTGRQTVTATYLYPLYLLAAAHACMHLAADMASESDGRQGVDLVNHGDGQSRYERQAKMFREGYERLMGISTGGEGDGAPTLATSRRRWQSRNVFGRYSNWIIRGDE